MLEGGAQSQPTNLTFYYEVRWQLATIDSVDGCSVLPETQFFGTHLHADTIQALPVGGFLHTMGTAGEIPEFDIKPPLTAPLMIFRRDYLLNFFPIEDTSTRQQGCEIRVFHLLG